MAARPIDNLSVIVSASTRELSADLRGADRLLSEFSRRAEKAAVIPATRPNVSRAVADQQRATTRFQAQATRPAVADFPQMRQVMQTPQTMYGWAKAGVAAGVGFAAAEAGVSGLAGAFQGLRQSINMAADLEQTKLAFEVMIGDARRAATLVADVRKFGAETPFGNSELIDASRQLLAYGFAAERVVGDLRMLGDVSAAFGDRLKIGDLTYLYGTLFTQQRAYTRDLMQFAGRGIPIYRELASVLGRSSSEIRQMAEEGRISFDEVEQAFRRMTSVGGTFYGMTARQSKTFAGIAEQMRDAFKVAQTKLGQVLIEELGLHEATRDLEGFAKKLDAFFDSPRFRKGVAFFGNLAKAAANMGFELVRAVDTIGRINIDSLEKAFPGIKATADSFSAFLKEAKEFKFDEEKLVHFGANFARMMATTFGSIAEGAAHAFEWVGEKVRPLVQFMDRLDGMGRAWDRVNAPNAVGNREERQVNDIFALVRQGRFGDALESMPRATYSSPEHRLDGRRPGDRLMFRQIAPPLPGMAPERVLAEWEHLRQFERVFAADIERLRANGRDVAEPRAFQQFVYDLSVVRQRMNDYADSFVHDRATNMRFLNQGAIPAIRGAPGTEHVPAAGVPAPAASRDTLGAAVGVPVSIELGGLPPEKWADRMLRAIDQISEEALGRIREQRRATGLEQFRAALNPMMTGAGFHDLAMAAGTTFPPRRDQAADTQAARAAGIGFAAVQLPPVPPDVQQLMLDLRQRYDPMTTLAPFRQQLDQIRDRGLLGDRSQQFTDAAWRERLRDVGARFGLDDQHPRLPSATEVGSAEDARLMNAWASQRTEQSTESLLQQIINLASQQLGVQSKTLEFVAKPVVMLKPPP